MQAGAAPMPPPAQPATQRSGPGVQQLTPWGPAMASQPTPPHPPPPPAPPVLPAARRDTVHQQPLDEADMLTDLLDKEAKN